MSYQNRFMFSMATPEDAEGIRRLFAAQNFDGNIAVQYLRGENPIESFLKEGDEFVCLVLRDTEADNNIIGMGSCVIRKGYANGTICNIGYLTGLKLLPDYHKKFLGIAKAYQWIQENTMGKVDYYYTTILAVNIYVQKMLEKKRKNMPLYQGIGDYHTLIFKTCGIKRQVKGLAVRACSGDTARNFYAKKATKYLFSVAEPLQNDLANSTFYALYRGDDIIAVTSVLDQRNYKQYIVKRYGGMYNLARFLPTGILGYPNFPKIGKTVSLASASIYHDSSTSSRELRYFWGQVLSSYKNTELVMIGLHHHHPVLSALKGLKSVGYKSKIYRVSYNQSDKFDLTDIAGIDVALC